MREIVIRFVLTTLAYEGAYLSFRGGQHDVTFPPTPPTEGEDGSLEPTRVPEGDPGLSANEGASVSED